MSKKSIIAIGFCTAVAFYGVSAFAIPAHAHGVKSPSQATINCADAYGGANATCERIPCNALYRSFLGTWTGQFWAYVRNRSTRTRAVYRPDREAVTYTASDCLKNLKTADTFIIGHQIERYPSFDGLPAKTAKNLLITGEKADGTPFLRVTMGHQIYDFALAYKNSAAKLAVWKLHIPASKGQPQMTYTTIDGRNFASPKRTRIVTMTLAVGPTSAPYWQGVIAYGSHTKQ